MSKRLFHVILALIVGFLFVLGDAFLLCAQETATEEFTLEEITVTAQKREENQQKVPIAMEVISGEALAGTGQDNVSEILQNLSNAIINMASAGMKVTLRGISEDESEWNDMRISTPTVAINVDGSYNTAFNAGHNLFDLERVEVLYGPQSTMYGSNSPGGIVNIVTAAPKTDKYSASGSVEYGSFRLLNMQASVNAPVVSDKFAVRLAAQRSKKGTWVDGGDNASKNTSARLKALYQATDTFSATLTGTWSVATSGGRLGGAVELFEYQDEVDNPWTATEDADAGGGGGMPPMAMGFLVPAQAPPPPGGAPSALGADQYSKGLSGELSWDTFIGGLSIVPSWSKNHSKDTGETTYTQETFENGVLTRVTYDTQMTTTNTNIQKNAEIRLANPRDFFFTWIVGATYYNSERENINDDLIFDDNDGRQVSAEINKGLYANVTYPFTEKFRGTVGYRQSWDEAEMTEVGTRPSSGGQDYSRPDIKYGLEYDAADNHMIFASYTTSYRVNMGANLSRGGASSRNIGAEKMKAFTVGAKSRFLGNKMQVNASAFYYDYKNKQFKINDAFGVEGLQDESDYALYDDEGNVIDFPDFNNNEVMDTAGPGRFEDPYGDQYGSFRTIGLDVSTNWIITNKDMLNVSLSYLNAEWKDAIVHYYWYWLSDMEGMDMSGMKNTFSPAWSGTVSYQHNFVLGSVGALTPKLDVQFKSSYKLSFLSEEALAARGYAPKVTYQEPYYLLNGSVTYSHSRGKWNVNAYVKNAMNYAVKTYLNASSTGSGWSLGLNDPRTYGAVLSVKF